MNIVLKIEGMSCEKCEQRIIKMVSGMPGVEKVQASASEGTVVVEGEGINTENIGAVIEDMGFSVS